MTSRQPETTPPDTRGRQAQDLLVRMLPLVLLIILGLAGLRGAVTEPRWDGPLHRDGLVIGLVLEVVLGVLLVITLRRQAVARNAGIAAMMAKGPPVSAVAAKLRAVLTFVLGVGMAAVAVVTIIGLHLRLFTKEPRIRSNPGRTKPAPTITPSRGLASSSTFHLPLAALLYALLVVLLLAAIAISIWYARRLRPPIKPRADDFIAEDSENLRDAVESGRSALRALDDARAAIIACYVAMETHLGERGAARAAADTPDELLTRATETGIVRGTAAARLTALFYEARFSSHPLDRGQRDAAEQALDELAAALAESETETGADV
jgi:hypothetical protein